jgi:hypothetical protein
MALEIGTECIEIDFWGEKNIYITDSFYRGFESEHHRFPINSDDAKRGDAGIVIICLIDTYSARSHIDAYFWMRIDIVEEVDASKNDEDDA